MTREEYLNNCVEHLREHFKGADFPLPEKIRVTCGFPSRSGLSPKKRRIGEAWSDKCSGDAHHEVFISPTLDDIIEVLATLVHELAHCAVGVEHMHKGPFRRCATAVGLVGKMTCTEAGEKLKVELQQLADEVGKYPHAALVYNSERKKQTTRMLKIECPSCGYTVRTTAKWIEVGLPTCVCGGEMQAC